MLLKKYIMIECCGGAPENARWRMNSRHNNLSGASEGGMSNSSCKKSKKENKKKGRKETGQYKYTWFFTADTYGYLSGNDSDMTKQSAHLLDLTQMIV